MGERHLNNVHKEQIISIKNSHGTLIKNVHQVDTVTNQMPVECPTKKDSCCLSSANIVGKLSSQSSRIVKCKRPVSSRSQSRSTPHTSVSKPKVGGNTPSSNSKSG